MRAPHRKSERAIIALSTLFAGAALVLPPRAAAQTPSQIASQTPSQIAIQTAAQTAIQTITVRMLNGRSGKPMRGRSLRVEFQGRPANSTLPTERTTVTIDRHGNATLTVPSGATALSLIAATRGKGSTQPAYTVCGPFGQFIPINDILERGFVPQNACSSTLRLTALPGEILYLIEPLPWYNPALQ